MWMKLLSVVLAMLFCAGCALQAATSGRVVVRDDRAAVELRFSDRDRARIEDHYKVEKRKKTPPGLAKREHLPPGLVKHGTLPPGLQGRSLPRELETRLDTLPAPYVRVIIGRDILLLNRNTRLVMDILYDIAD